MKIELLYAECKVHELQSGPPSGYTTVAVGMRYLDREVHFYDVLGETDEVWAKSLEAELRKLLSGSGA
jgi:hypothetical protein